MFTTGKTNQKKGGYVPDLTKNVAFAKKQDNREIFVLTLKMIYVKPSQVLKTMLLPY